MLNSARYFLLDVFTSQRFGGNQLAIFPDANDFTERQMSTIARELQLSETVFVIQPKDKNNHYGMRIFTPQMELPTAGHPTIGTSFFMVRYINFDEEIDHIDLSIEQQVGIINAKVNVEKGIPVFSSMYQPLPEFIKTIDNKKDFARMLSVEENAIGDTPIEVISCGVPFTFIPIRSLALIKEVKLNVTIWEEMKERYGISFIYVFTTETENPDHHVHGRMFAPEAGIAEDAATGAANGPLGCYLYKHNAIEQSEDNATLISEQGFEMGRPSLIHIEITEEEGKINQVKIGGHSVLIGQGQIFLD
ncbi:MAG: PhzF family phenazine biosynthesis protein [Cyclobacteriaceae bacterium]